MPPKAARVFDPFAGGGTRAVFSTYAGCVYRGIELRQQEADSVNAMLVEHGLSNRGMVICADARDMLEFVPEGSVELIFTCPPYWNLEQYHGGADDLSMCSAEDFELGMAQIINECFSALEPGGFSVWVTGITRNDQGGIVHVPNIVSYFHRAAGFMLHDEAILFDNSNQALQRIGNFSKGAGLLIRRHEYNPGVCQAAKRQAAYTAAAAGRAHQCN